MRKGNREGGRELRWGGVEEHERRTVGTPGNVLGHQSHRKQTSDMANLSWSMNTRCHKSTTPSLSGSKEKNKFTKIHKTFMKEFPVRILLLRHEIVPNGRPPAGLLPLSLPRQIAITVLPLVSLSRVDNPAAVATIALMRNAALELMLQLQRERIIENNSLHDNQE